MRFFLCDVGTIDRHERIPATELAIVRSHLQHFLRESKSDAANRFRSALCLDSCVRYELLDRNALPEPIQKSKEFHRIDSVAHTDSCHQRVF